MGFLTDKEIQQRKAQGAATNRIDCGWKLPNEVIAKATTLINNWKPKTQAEERDKRILQLAFVHDMNASQIARLNDPLLVGMGNRSKGKPLSPASVWAICVRYIPEANKHKHKQAGRPTDKERIALLNGKKAGEINRPRICSACGSNDKTELHHIVPLAFGGSNDYFNLVYLCHDCHTKLHREIYSKLKIPNSTNIERLN